MQRMSTLLFVGLVLGVATTFCGCGPESSEDQEPMTISPEMVQKLTEGLQSTQNSVRSYSARQLGKLGADAQSAIGPLEEQLEAEAVPEVREAIEKAIEDIRAGG